MTMHFGSGGGVRLQVMIGLAVPNGLAAQLDGDDRAMHVLFARLGYVNEEYLPSVATAMDAAAALIPGAIGCTVVGRTMVDDHVTTAPVEMELLAAVNAARDALVASLAPFAPELERDAAWWPMLEQSGPYAEVGTSWLATELQLLAVIDGPLGRHTRVVHVSALGEHATILG